MCGKDSIITSDSNQKPWSPWHQRLHKELLKDHQMLPKHAALLIAVSGGQDSMALLKLLIDLKRIYQWQLYVWHGDHQWHNKSGLIARELEKWCLTKKVAFFLDKANKNYIKNEASARIWRYKKLEEKAKIISDKNTQKPCRRVLTGHTSSDRAETFLFNLARGANLAGLGSLRKFRSLNNGNQTKLVRPLFLFSRAETATICKEMGLPIWIDPSNDDINYSRNRIRKEVIPVFEKLHPGSALRISNLSERLSHYYDDQLILTSLALNALKHPKGLCRRKLAELPLTIRTTLLELWLKQSDIKELSAKQLKEICFRLENMKPAGKQDLTNGWQIIWKKEFVEIKNIKNS